MLKFRKFVKIAILLIYLVIIAGSVVRMTGSGMGCPDWPKCFGYIIPPTSEDQILFQPHINYKKGSIIIFEEALWKAKQDFRSSQSINIKDWEAYTRHDYAQFNATHTWIEYINRLTGALSGIPILIFTFISFGFWKKNKLLPLLSILCCISMGVQAWLGKTVVDSNLLPYKITIHMVMAVFIVSILIYLYHLSNTNKKPLPYLTKFKWATSGLLLLLVIQIVLGTQVRQQVDEAVIEFGYNKAKWLTNPDWYFYLHRSLSLLFLGILIFIYLKTRKMGIKIKSLNYIYILVILEILMGMIMYYADFPFSTQAIHLFLSLLLYGLLFDLWLKSKSAIPKPSF